MLNIQLYTDSMTYSVKVSSMRAVGNFVYRAYAGKKIRNYLKM